MLRQNVFADTDGSVARLTIENLSKSFGAAAAVDDLSFSVAAGELFSLLGPSGCGKTTLLRMLAGLETPDHGRVLIDGEDVTELPAHQRPVNMMFQSYALFPHMNVFDNVAFGLRRTGLDRDELRRRVTQLLALVRLQDFGRRRPDQLSGGQQQRVALARALARRPRLLLLDEPLAALDRRLRESTALELKRLQRETGTTFIMVTHDQDEAMTLSTRVAVMFDGRIHQIASPREMYEKPMNRLVAEFIGDANFIDGRVVEHMGGLVIVASDGGARFAVATGGCSVSLGDPVTIGVRPERMTTSTDAGATNSFGVRIEGVLYHGDVSVCHARAADGAAYMIKLANDGTRPGPGIDESLWLRFDPADAFLLRR
jgi:putrescine transport system ATP-binding protein